MTKLLHLGKQIVITMVFMNDLLTLNFIWPTKRLLFVYVVILTFTITTRHETNTKSLKESSHMTLYK